MLLRALVLAALGLAAAPGAAADPICRPPQGAGLTVSGLRPGDTLNVRTGPGTANRAIDHLREGERGARATGRVGFLTEVCRLACERLNRGDQGFRSVVTRDCIPSGRIWYELVTPRGIRGWGSARFLTVRDAAPPGGRPPGIILPPGGGGDRPTTDLPGIGLPPNPGGGGDRPTTDPPPRPAGETLRFACQNGERLTVVLFRQGSEAEVTLRDGARYVLAGVASPSEFVFRSAAAGGMLLEGDRGGVRWIGPGSRNGTRCFPGG